MPVSLFSDAQECFFFLAGKPSALLIRRDARPDLFCEETTQTFCPLSRPGLSHNSPIPVGQGSAHGLGPGFARSLHDAIEKTLYILVVDLDRHVGPPGLAEPEPKGLTENSSQ
jgi:hypothetical protein